MKRFGTIALSALMLGGVALAAATPAAAHVSIGIGIGVPGPYYGNPCAYPRFRYFHPGACYYPAYSSPVFIDGAWYSGPHYYRYYGGRPWIWYHNDWRSDFRGGWRGHDRDDWHHDRDGGRDHDWHR